MLAPVFQIYRVLICDLFSFKGDLTKVLFPCDYNLGKKGTIRSQPMAYVMRNPYSILVIPSFCTQFSGYTLSMLRGPFFIIIFLLTWLLRYNEFYDYISLWLATKGLNLRL